MDNHRIGLFAKEQITMTKTLTEIIRRHDLQSLEALCIRLRKYSAVVEQARTEGVDLDELEEMLAEI